MLLQQLLNRGVLIIAYRVSHLRVFPLKLLQETLVHLQKTARRRGQLVDDVIAQRGAVAVFLDGEFERLRSTRQQKLLLTG